MTETRVCQLLTRQLLRVHGDDAADLLQNTLTNDIRRITDENPLQYNLLLTPQGKILHEVFVVRRAENDFLLDVAATRQADLLRRLTMFKLRARVTLEDIPPNQGLVFAAYPEAPQGQAWIPDPRQPGIGARYYALDGTAPAETLVDEGSYDDFCIGAGVTTAQSFRHEQDFVHDLGLEKQNAIAWDKGCFIGQEVAARVEHRGLAKKGLFVAFADHPLRDDMPLTTADGFELGEVRHISRDRQSALVMAKIIALQGDTAIQQDGHAVELVRKAL